MATVIYSAGFSNLSDWTGYLLEARLGTSFTSKTATSAVIKHGAGHPFANFAINFAGTGFSYEGNTATGGVLKSVVIKNDAGQAILTIAGIAASVPSVGEDFSAICFSIMGSTDANGNNIGPDPKSAWSHLLSGADIVTGTGGNDRELVGLDYGDDTYNLLGGDDRINGGIGNDRYNGGDGHDVLSFSETTFNDGASAHRGIVVNMATGRVVDNWSGTDTIAAIEEVLGSRFADVFVGSAGEDRFAGLAGADKLDGGANANDKVYYYEDVWKGGKFGIVANLTAGTVKDGFGNRDTVKNIEWVLGTRFNDSFIGSAKRDVFIGDAGADSYDGRANPLDTGEADRIQFNWTFSDRAQAGINVDLSRANGQIINDGYGNVETCKSIEGIIGSNQNDSIKGALGINLFAGADGRDTMTGAGGRNEYVWWDINHFSDGDIITDFSAAFDKLSFEHNNFGGMDVLRLENDLSPATIRGTFLFDNASDMLFWDANGALAGERFAVVKLPGVGALTAANFELY